MKYTDEQLMELWERFRDIPVTDDNVLGADFVIDENVTFHKGEDAEDVWHWFDGMHSKGVYVLMKLNKEEKGDTVEEEKDTEITKVMFRKYRKAPKEIVAVFPYLVFSPSGDCTCYQHVGQHGEANYFVMLNITVPATEEEAAPLRRELESIGYNLAVIKKRQWNEYHEALEADRIHRLNLEKKCLTKNVERCTTIS